MIVVVVVVVYQWLHEEVLNTADSQKATTLAGIRKVTCLLGWYTVLALRVRDNL